MKKLIYILFLFTFFSCTENRTNTEILAFELRLAQTEPDSTLQKMVFYNTDKTFFVHDSVYLTNKEIVSTDIIDWQTQPKVHVRLNEAGRKNFAEFTKNYVGKNAAMIVDNKLMSAPRIQAQITKGELLIVGFFDHEEAQSIAKGILLKN